MPFCMPYMTGLNTKGCKRALLKEGHSDVMANQKTDGYLSRDISRMSGY